MPTSAKGAPLPAADAPSTTQRRVLVVDDHENACDAIGMLIGASGFSVRCAYDGPSAIDAALQFLPQVVLLDISMPKMDGFEVARTLRAHAATRDAALIAFTAFDMQMYREQARRLDYCDYIVKPADATRLLTALNDCFEAPPAGAAG